jgi:hypothetical protein
MEQENREERRAYQYGYDDGRRGWRAYNDTFVDVTGPVIVWKLNSSRYAESYAQGFCDSVENDRTVLNRKTILVIAASVCSSVASFIALWR